MKINLKTNANATLSKKVIIATIILMSICVGATLFGSLNGAFQFDNELPGNFFEYDGLLWIILAPFALYGGYFGLKTAISDFFNTDVKEIETTTYSDGRKESRDTGNGCLYQLFNIFLAPILCGIFFSAVAYYLIYLLVSFASATFPFIIVILMILMILTTIFIPRKLFSMGKVYSIYLIFALSIISVSIFAAISTYSVFTDFSRSEMQMVDKYAPNYYCTASVLNLRNSPSTQGRVVGAIKKGEEIYVYSSTPIDGFYKIRYNEGVVYSSSDYLEKMSTTAIATESSNQSQGVSPAKKMFELKGNVKSCKVKTTGEDYSFISEDVEFDANGLLIRNRKSYYNYNSDGSFKSGYYKEDRDDFVVMLNIDNLRQITTISVERVDKAHDEENYKVNYSYDKNGFVSESNCIGYGMVDMSYTRDNKGLITNAKSASWESGITYASNLVYTYVSFDEKGNWTEVNIKDICTLTDDYSRETVETTTLKRVREITYYD